MSSRSRLGGVIHTYQRYDPREFPSPTQPPGDVVSPAFEHLLAHGSLRELTDEELAQAVRLDPSQIVGFGPSIEALRKLLEERKRKILAQYETRKVQKLARDEYANLGEQCKPPRGLRKKFRQAFREEQLHDLERIWYMADRQSPKFARGLVHLIDRLGNKYQVDELASKYTFTGREKMTIPQALEIKEELETIDRLLKQLEEA